MELDLMMLLRAKDEDLRRLADAIGVTSSSTTTKAELAVMVRARIERERMIDGLRKLTGQRR